MIWGGKIYLILHPFITFGNGLSHPFLPPRTIWILFRPHHHHPRAHIQAIDCCQLLGRRFLFQRRNPGNSGNSRVYLESYNPLLTFDHLVLQLLCTVFQIFDIRISFALCRKFINNALHHNHSNVHLLASIFHPHWEKSLWRVFPHN